MEKVDPASPATLTQIAWIDGYIDLAESTDLVTRRGFTDHEHLDDAELIHMNGRVYDYNLGRFLSVDPFIQEPGNSQSMNPYSYIMNNPLSGTDPSGYKFNKKLKKRMTGTRIDRSKLGKTTASANVAGIKTEDVSKVTINKEKGTVVVAKTNGEEVSGTFDVDSTNLQSLSEIASNKGGQGINSDARCPGCAPAVANLGILGRPLIPGATGGITGNGSSLSVGGVPILDKNGNPAISRAITGNNNDDDDKNIVYRALKKEDLISIRLGGSVHSKMYLPKRAKHRSAIFTLDQHILEGSDETAWGRDNFISTTKDLLVAEGFDSGYGIIRINLDMLDKENYVDARVFAMSPAARETAYAEQEIAIKRIIPSYAIEGFEVEPTKQ